MALHKLQEEVFSTRKFWVDRNKELEAKVRQTLAWVTSGYGELLVALLSRPCLALNGGWHAYRLLPWRA